MASMSSYLEEKNINLLIQIHDELLFEIPNSLDLDSTIKDLKGFMQNAYEYKKMPLTCSASISVKSWADAEERD
jgi:DNA polymerase I-like protein with 3'-5' exonuclease and polymerase domains